MSSTAARFGQIVEQRRLQLDLTQLDVHAAGGPSNSTLTSIENGRLEELTRATARKLDKGLQWEQGSARVAWQGGDPTPLQPSPATPRTPDELESVRRHVAQAAIDDGLRYRLLALIDESQERGATG